MAGAITYAASTSIDEITAGSIPVSRGGSIPVSAKVEAVNGTQSKNRPYRILNLERLREFATNPAAQFFREVESPEGGDRSEPPAAVALDQAIEAPGALFEDFPKTILPLEAPSGSLLFELKEKLAQTERLLVAMTEQQDRDTADFEARLANVEGTLRSIKVIFSERLF